MKRTTASFSALAATLGFGLVAATVGACSDDRDGFDGRDSHFDVPPEGGIPDAEVCYHQCSLDGRSVIQSCTGEVLETCADDLACGAAKCQEPCAAAAADKSSNGCEFFLSNAHYSGGFPQSCHAAFVVNSSNQPATLSLEHRGRELDLSKALYRVVPNSTDLEPLEGPIAPGESAIVFISDRDQSKSRTVAEKMYYMACPYGIKPAVEADFSLLQSGIGEAFQLKSNTPVGLTSMYPYGGAGSYIPTATLVLPVSAWAKEHMVVNGWEASFGLPVAQIFASEDDTEITILGRQDIANGVGFKGGPANTPTKVSLSKGQFVQLIQYAELTGSVVTSNKPTVTVGGNTCVNIPNGAGACDTLSQQIPPFEQWGSEYVGVGYRPRTASEDEPIWYRIVAARDGTDLEYDPVKPAGAPVHLAAGEAATFRARSNDAFVVRSRDADHPFYVATYMSGADRGGGNPGFGGQGDPEFVNVIPTGQFMSSYSFYADSTYAEHSLVIVRQKLRGEFKDVWLECAGNLPEWKPVDSRGEFEFTRVDLSRSFGPGDRFGDKRCTTGLQRMRSDGPFSATLWGWGTYASYAYPGGMALRKLVDTPLSPVN